MSHSFSGVVVQAEKTITKPRNYSHAIINGGGGGGGESASLKL